MKRFLVVPALMLLVLVGLAPASAAPRQPIEYDALGDSYASGFGVGPYFLPAAPCYRSQSAYAEQVEGREKIRLDDFVACAGATIPTLVSGGQLNALDGATDLVTISVGGNDIRWSSAVQACLGGTDAQCQTTLTQVRAAVEGPLGPALNALYAQIAVRAPHAHVFVIGYPRLFSPEYGAYLGASAAEQGDLNAGADLLNSVIADAATSRGFEFVDVTKRFLGHGVNAPDPWVLGPSDPGRFHPNAAGYETYAAAVTAAVNPARLR